MTSPPVPPQAITAAVNAIERQGRNRGTVESLARAALEAAAPHLATARLDEAQAAAYATGVTDGAAAERERCAELAETEAARLTALKENWADVSAGTLEDFAALLRKAQP